MVAIVAKLFPPVLDRLPEWRITAVEPALAAANLATLARCRALLGIALELLDVADNEKGRPFERPVSGERQDRPAKCCSGPPNSGRRLISLRMTSACSSAIGGSTNP